MIRGAAPACLAVALLACSAPALGIEALFNDYHAQLRLLEQRALIFHSLPQWALVLNLVAALTLLALRRVQAEIPHYPWLLGASITGNGYFLEALGLAPPDSLLVDALVLAWLYCLFRILYPKPAAKSQRSLTLGVWLIALCVLIDTILLLGDVHLPGHPDNVLQSVPLGQIAGVLLALYFLVASHVVNLQQLATLNASLDQRVQEVEAELDDRYSMLTRDAVDAAALHERKSIYQSIHEDLSDKLLQLIYSATKPETADLARSALAELRDSHKLHPDQSHMLTDILADAYAEAQTRCDQAGLTLEWQADDELQLWTLTARQESALTRTVREAISNLLKHAQASQVAILFMAHDTPGGRNLFYRIADNGRGINATHRPGRGLVNTHNRMQELGGSVTIEARTQGGTQLHFTLPVTGSTAACR